MLLEFSASECQTSFTTTALVSVTPLSQELVWPLVVFAYTSGFSDRFHEETTWCVELFLLGETVVVQQHMGLPAGCCCEAGFDSGYSSHDSLWRLLEVFHDCFPRASSHQILWSVLCGVRVFPRSTEITPDSYGDDFRKTYPYSAPCSGASCLSGFFGDGVGLTMC